MELRKHWWGVTAAGLLLVYLGVSLRAPRSFGVTAFGDITTLILLALATWVMLRNCFPSRGRARAFWILMTVGCALWALNQSLWTYYEVWLRRDIPDPFVGDVVLFLHIVPMMAAVALRPHRSMEDAKPHFNTLNTLMLLLWWVFLYAFVVFPDEYVSLNVAVYSRNYDLLYLLESLALLGVLGTLAATTRGYWRKIYGNLFLGAALYAFSSESMNAAIARNQYYTGSWYDVPFLTSVCWFVWVGLSGRNLDLNPAQEVEGRGRWAALAPRLAMLAILSLPLLGLWTLFFDKAPMHVQHVRLGVTLGAALALGLCVFLKQYLLDHELIRLLEDSHKNFENLQRVQTQLVQQEKLASLGQLVAGAAHEINNPLTAILGYSDLLATHDGIGNEPASMARKIGQHARRTRSLVSDLLSFARQSPAERSLVDVGAVASRAVKMEGLHFEGKKVRVETMIEPDLPPVWGNANQIFQVCVQVLQNAGDALQDVGGGLVEVCVRSENGEVVAKFSDNGPGIREPGKVFDPFYTTKPIGKGTGLGLSASYGIVQDHHGHISCHNRAEGGAVFTLRLPVASQPAMAAVQAAKA
jgi:signal transduction histidine kinase